MAIAKYRCSGSNVFERIVVPLDGSRLSTLAIPYAVEVGKRFDAEIILVRVLSPSESAIASQATVMESDLTSDVIDREARMKNGDNMADIKRYLITWSQSLKTQGVKASYQVTIGTPAKSIMELVEAQQASLIVMMSHGRGWFKRAIMGSVADEILKGSSVPVLIIRAQESNNK